MKRKDDSLRVLSEGDVESLPDYLIEANYEWYREYQLLDERIAEIDLNIWNLNLERHAIEQRMAELDLLFNPYLE